MTRVCFPTDFVWGAATSAHQIEGAVAAEGKGLSQWDVFEREPGRIADATTAAVACDHYHRYRDDVALMTDLGLRAYRFSIAWPRILPKGRGRPNAAGLDFYERLVDALMEAGITPHATLYHWDLPAALQDELGGWTARDTCDYFADYAEICARRLGDRVRHWATHNEPGVAMEAYLDGTMPPGEVSRKKAYQVAHHILLSHGLAAEALRAASPVPVKVGIVEDLWPVHPAEDTPACLAAARERWDMRWGWFLEPVLRGRYPEGGLERLGDDRPHVAPGDMERICQPLDFFGLNYYSRVLVDERGADIARDGQVTDMGWEVYPDGLHAMLRLLHDDYGVEHIYITENGAAFADEAGPDGRVADTDRRDFLASHLAAVARAIDDGVPVRGYFAWSLLDNFEWAFGLSKRFGIVHVDYETQRRTPKTSARWYARVIAEGGFDGEGHDGRG